MPQYKQSFTLAGYGMGSNETERAVPGRPLRIGGMDVPPPETITDPELRELALHYRNSQAAGQDTTETRRLMAQRVSHLLRQRSSSSLWAPKQMLLWTALGGLAGYGVAKAAKWDTKRTTTLGAAAGFILRVLKGITPYADDRLSANVVEGAAETSPTAVGSWR